MTTATPSTPLRHALEGVRSVLAPVALAALCGLAFAQSPPAPSSSSSDNGAATAPSATPAAPVKTGTWEHAITAYGTPKYPPGFKHFEYVDPDAPKGGTLRLSNPDRRSSFDKFNPFTVKGVPPAGVTLFMIESLAFQAQDEPMSMYGLIAESMMVAPDLSSITFRLRREARFNNGDPVLAKDVVHSFTQMTSPQAAPGYRTIYAPIARVVEVDPQTVRFELRERKIDALFIAGGVPIFSHKWGAGKKFDEIVAEPPISSGAYTIARYEMPRTIEFKRDPDYWAKDLGVRRGHFNFDRIVYRMYKDTSIRLEAFKAGEFDLIKEYRARNWFRLHKGPKWDDGRIQKAALETATGQGMQSTIINLRREKFQDIRVREAMLQAWDFETVNRYGSFKRANSLFNNADFAAQGVPSSGELKLLEPYRAELPARVFGPAFVAPRSDTHPTALRENLRKARDLLAQAGWNVAADGLLRNAKGEAFEFEYLEPNQIGRNPEFQRNLKLLGITMTERLVDFALYRRRLDQYDFDAVTIVGGDFTLPDATELEAILGSKAADENGNGNHRGVKSRVVDELLNAISSATTYDALRDAARALDRVVTWNFWQIPELYNSREQVSYWNRFGIPKVQPKYFTIDTNIGANPWPIWAWWDKSLDKRN